MRKTGLLLIGILVFVSLHLQGRATAQTTVVVSDPQRRAPIALPVLCLAGGATQAEAKIPRIIAKDLSLSGYFTVLPREGFVENPGDCTPPAKQGYGDWRVVRAEWLVKGKIEGRGPNVKAQLYLHDVPGERPVLGKEYTGTVDDIRRMAHRFANEVMRVVTGEAGPFGSSIAYSSRIGRFKDLFLMDMDGANVRQLTREKGLALSPSWDPGGTTLLYTSYRRRIPDLYLLDIITSSTIPLTKGPALEVGGVLTKKGTVITSLTEHNDSSLVELDKSGQVVQTLTPRNRAIDVSPTMSPDGSQIAFCSDRGGGPQIYVMSRSGGGARRVSFVTSRYCTSPAWSPKGNYLAFVCRADGGFQLFVSAPDGSNPIQLTSGGDNEDPSWSPDGRYIAFASTFGKKSGFNLAMMRVVRNMEGSHMSQLTYSRGDDTQPAWGPIAEK